MKVLFLTTWYPTKEKPSAAIFVKEHVRAIKLSGVDITVLFLNVNHSSALYKSSVEYFRDENDVQTIQVNILSRYWKKIYAIIPFLFLMLKREVRKLRRENHSFDFIHSCVISPGGIMGFWLSKELKIPHFISEHWSKRDRFFAKNIYSKTGKNAYRTASAITVVSEFLKRQVLQNVPELNNLHIIPNIIDDTVFFFTQKKQNSNEIIFTAVANWEDVKRPDLFTEALNRIQSKTGKKIILNIIGTGSKLDPVLQRKDLIVSLNAWGRKNKKEISDLLRTSDFFVHATETETFSIVVAEALSTGTPVIASNVGGIPELVQNEQLGLLCKNNLEDWTAKLMKAMSTNFDHQYVANFHKGKFSVQHVGEKFRSLYEEILKRSG